jgi:PhnB protein
MPDTTSTSNVTPVPEHLHTVTPRLVVSDAAAAIDFYVAAFGAEEISDRFQMPDGTIVHVEIRIGDSVVMLTEGGAEAPVGPALLCAYWQDVDAAWERALQAGAEILYPLADHFYGERGGRLRDPFGHQWMMSMRIENVSQDEMDARLAVAAESGQTQ